MIYTSEKYWLKEIKMCLCFIQPQNVCDAAELIIIRGNVSAMNNKIGHDRLIAVHVCNYGNR